MEYQIIFSSQANLDYLDTIHYYLEQSPTIAEKFDHDLNEMLNIIQSNPEMLRRLEKATQFRRTHLLKFKQQIIYQLFEEKKVILIVAIMHHSRNSNRLVKRLT